jgi:hypothetical protein
MTSTTAVQRLLLAEGKPTPRVWREEESDGGRPRSPPKFIGAGKRGRGPGRAARARPPARMPTTQHLCPHTVDSDDEPKMPEAEPVLVTPEFDQNPTPVKEYFIHLEQRLHELQVRWRRRRARLAGAQPHGRSVGSDRAVLLRPPRTQNAAPQNLLGASEGQMPSTYEKYLHGEGLPVATSAPLVTAREYYEQLKALRGDSQVRGDKRAPSLRRRPPRGPPECAARPCAIEHAAAPSARRSCLLPRHPQVYYPVAPEVYRDLMWEDVEGADLAEYHFCRYTPVTTEVRPPASGLAQAVARRPRQPAMLCGCTPTASLRGPARAVMPRPRLPFISSYAGRARLWKRRLPTARSGEVWPPHQALHLRDPLQRGPGDARQDAAGHLRGERCRRPLSLPTPAIRSP